MKATFQETKENLELQIENIYSHMSQYPWTERKAYGDWLYQTYVYVNHATRVLCHAAAHTAIEDGHLHRKFLKGVNEEKDHEIMAENDLNKIGLGLDSFEELPETSAYYQCLYYSVDMLSPYSLLGYFAVLEGLGSLKLKVITVLLQKTYGKNAVTFLEEHCLLDVDHFDEGLEFLQSCSPEQLYYINKAASLSGSLYKNIIIQLLQKYSTKQKQHSREYSLSV